MAKTRRNWRIPGFLDIVLPVFLGKTIRFVVAGYLIGAAALLSAETIRLKNGRSILADSVRETDKRVEYTIGEDTYAISKTLVDRIDSGGSPVVTRSREELPVPVVTTAIPALHGPADLQSKIVHDGKVDVEALNAVTQSGDTEASALAHFYAAEQEQQAGSLPKAVAYMEQALRYAPDNAPLLTNQAALLIKVNRAGEAQTAAARATRLQPDSATAWALLGYAQYQQGKMKEALASLRKAIEFDPNGEFKSLLTKIEREEKAESGMDEQASSHFVVRYEGGQAPASLRRQMLDTLEAHYNDLVRELDFLPHDPIQVLLYTDQQYFDVTHAPRWTGAVNDGKLRVPISGVEQVTSEISRTLRHELVHSFINAITHGRAPTWVHEGIAQMLEPRTSGSNGRRLSALYASNRNIPLNELEGSFIKFSDAEANVAYAQALVSAEYIRDTYGMTDLVWILKRIGEGQSTESAMRTVIHSGYEQFQREITGWLQRTYGS